MKILALIGSPRKGGNTDILVEQILKGLKRGGHSGEKLYLYDYEILPCLDCRGCKGGDRLCALRDGMNEIYQKLQDSDLIIFGTPIYWYGPTGKMKLLIDRMRPFIASGGLKGKRSVDVCAFRGRTCLLRTFNGDVPHVFRLPGDGVGRKHPCQSLRAW